MAFLEAVWDENEKRRRGIARNLGDDEDERADGETDGDGEEEEEEEEEAVGSLEIRFKGNRIGSGVGGATHRPRCNTEVKLDKMRKEKKRAMMLNKTVRTVNWKEIAAKINATNAEGVADEDVDEMFPAGPLTSHRTDSSLLSALMESTGSGPAPFSEFAQFAAASDADDAQSRRAIRVFFDMCAGRDRAYPLRVMVAGHATVRDAVGLACLEYTRAGRKPDLRADDVDGYAFYLAEPDGSVDLDFPALDKKEPMSKFGFDLLGLVDVGGSGADGGEDLEGGSRRRVTVVLPDGTFTVLDFDSPAETSLGQVMERALESRRTSRSTFAGHVYDLEKKDQQGEHLDKVCERVYIPTDSLIRCHFAGVHVKRV